MRLQLEQLCKWCAEIDKLRQQSRASFCLEEQCFLMAVRWQGNYPRSRWTVALSSGGSNFMSEVCQLI